jgi:hypothetical protein
MADGPHRTYRAGQRIEDQCRACKAPRTHVVVAVTTGGEISQVVCDFCGSRHRYHGGEAPTSRAASELVSERERSFPMPEAGSDLEMILRRVIREETGLTPVAPAEKWRGGELVLRPRASGLQEKTWPIDAFFHKVVMLRNRLRVLEQNINALEIPEDVKIKMQSYITGCYGSLTSFNVLFADPDDRFRGAGGDD